MPMSEPTPPQFLPVLQPGTYTQPPKDNAYYSQPEFAPSLRLCSSQVCSAHGVGVGRTVIQAGGKLLTLFKGQGSENGKCSRMQTL